jgi:hypothetical protein
MLRPLWMSDLPNAPHSDSGKFPNHTVTTARNSVRRKDWHFARPRLRAVVKLVASTKVLTLVGMRTRSTTNLPPLTAFLGLVRY